MHSAAFFFTLVANTINFAESSIPTKATTIVAPKAIPAKGESIERI